MKFIYKQLLDVLRFAEREMNKNEQTKEFYSEEIEFINEMKSFLFKESEIFFEIKGSDPF